MGAISELETHRTELDCWKRRHLMSRWASASVFLRSGVPVVPPEVGLGTRMAVIAAIDPTFYTTVSEARHLLDALCNRGCWGIVLHCVLWRKMNRGMGKKKKGTKVAKVSGREVGGMYNWEAPIASFLGPKLTMPILAFLTGVFSE